MDELTLWTTVVGLVVGILTLVAMIYAFTAFIMKRFRKVLVEEVEPIVHRIVQPVINEQAQVRQDLLVHMGVEQAIMAQTNVTLESQRVTMDRHIRDDEAFQRRVDEHIREQIADMTRARGDRTEILGAIHDLHASGSVPESDSPAT